MLDKERKSRFELCIWIESLCMSFLCPPLKIRKSITSGPVSAHYKNLQSQDAPASLSVVSLTMAGCHSSPYLSAVFLVEARGEWRIPCTHFSAGNVKIKVWSRRPQASRKMRRTIFLCGSKDDFFLYLNNFTHFCYFSKCRVHWRCQLCSTDSQHLFEGTLGVTLDRPLHLHHIQNGTEFISKQGEI